MFILTVTKKMARDKEGKKQKWFAQKYYVNKDVPLHSIMREAVTTLFIMRML